VSKGDLGASIAELLPRLRRFAAGLAGSLSDGDDVLQSAIEKALARPDQFRAGSRLDSWMFRIIQTTWFDQRGSAAVRLAGRPELLERMQGADEARGLEARSTLRTVERLIAQLPDDQRTVLMLVTVDGVSYREAAAILSIPVGTVMSRLARARLAIGRALDERMEAAE
jgi:RNA polymerase sigma-70 factor (ECF subfamily)